MNEKRAMLLLLKCEEYHIIELTAQHWYKNLLQITGINYSSD